MMDSTYLIPTGISSSDPCGPAWQSVRTVGILTDLLPTLLPPLRTQLLTDMQAAWLQTWAKEDSQGPWSLMVGAPPEQQAAGGGVNKVTGGVKKVSGARRHKRVSRSSSAAPTNTLSHSPRTVSGPTEAIPHHPEQQPLQSVQHHVQPGVRK
jgi:hypothetical protein